MLAEHMGGQISAHHRRPHGAELRVELPLVMASEPSLIQTTASLVQNHRSNASVLLVEDNPINQKVARWNLEQLGCNVNVAADGQAALSWLADHAPDLVIMDCEMPGMSGYEVTKSIRRGEDAMTRLSIVALTAHATAGAGAPHRSGDGRLPRKVFPQGRPSAGSGALAARLIRAVQPSGDLQLA